MQSNESENSQDEADKISQSSRSIDCRYMKSLQYYFNHVSCPVKECCANKST